MIISHFPTTQNTYVGGRFLPFTYTGEFSITDDMRYVRFLTSGTMTMLEDATVDLFLVGGGGRGGAGDVGGSGVEHYVGTGGGGGGGYTKTQSDVLLPEGNTYTLTIGRGGGRMPSTPTDDSHTNTPDGESTIFTDGSDVTITAAGGKGGTDRTSSSIGKGGNGGSGGATGSSGSIGEQDTYSASGGTDGSDGEGSSAGTGQGTTTRAFGEQDEELFASGGGSMYYDFYARASNVPSQPDDFHGADNTGNGGYGGTFINSTTEETGVAGGCGGSGIIILRLSQSGAGGGSSVYGNAKFGTAVFA